jgi:hypothetical protein
MVNPAKRMKLESFDRKIGKQPNIVQVCGNHVHAALC